jgi:hypothetical protein
MKNMRYFYFVSTLIIFSWVYLSNCADSLGLPISSSSQAFEHCGLQSRDAQQTHCIYSAIPVQAPILQSGATSIGRWQLVRSPGPQGGRDIVSIMHTADALRSDPDFAGLMIRCREKSGLQIALVVIRPFPPRAHPQVSIIGTHTTMRLQASVLPGGAALSLPNEAEVLAKGSWQSLSELAFAIEDDGVTIKGIVPLDNLSAALAFLQSNCP